MIPLTTLSNSRGPFLAEPARFTEFMIRLTRLSDDCRIRRRGYSARVCPSPTSRGLAIKRCPLTTTPVLSVNEGAPALLSGAEAHEGTNPRCPYALHETVFHACRNRGLPPAVRIIPPTRTFLAHQRRTELQAPGIPRHDRQTHPGGEPAGEPQACRYEEDQENPRPEERFRFLVACLGRSSLQHRELHIRRNQRG